MFDGTDLSLAYGGSVYEPPMMSSHVSVGPSAPPVMEPPVVSKATVSHSQPPDIPYNPPIAMYAQQSPTSQATVLADQSTFWDKISTKKMDVLKLFILAMVVLLGISMDKVATHYMTNYIGKAFLSETQEFLVRLSYPVIILVVLWFIKALT